MAQVFDEADYRRRLDQAAEISTTDELRLIINGNLDAQKVMNEAKQNALRQARKQMMQAIQDEDDKIRDSGVLPVDVTEVATGGAGDELVKVP